MRFAGKLYRRALGTSDYKLARRKLADFRNGFERTDTTKGKTSLGKTLDAYKATLTGAASTLEKKRAVAAKPRQTWFGCDSLPTKRSMENRRGARRNQPWRSSDHQCSSKNCE